MKKLIDKQLFETIEEIQYKFKKVNIILAGDFNEPQWYKQLVERKIEDPVLVNITNRGFRTYVD